MNIKTRISLQFTVTVMVILTITCVTVYTFTLEHRREIYENRLKDRASIIASIYKKEKDNFSIEKKFSTKPQVV